jgi:hypothetical protein
VLDYRGHMVEVMPYFFYNRPSPTTISGEFAYHQNA